MHPTIAPESPRSADSRALIAESQLALEAVYPPEEIFSLDAEDLAREAAAFLVARDAAGRAIGCVALVDCGGYGEVKRLFVRPDGRGHGLARALMAALEAEARGRGLAEVLLETGDRLCPAVALYESIGYRARGPFGAYPEHPASLFMGKGVA
ncbi:MAG: GNAT family N-acetyltransferase [Paracoccaceae bacterium]|nr:GNAT family N-acetyltransferase [Paracoccaceae bacterium]